MNALSELPTVFIVDDDRAVRDSLAFLLETAGLPVETYGSAEAFLGSVAPERSGCLVLDVRMSGMSGLDLQAELARRRIPLPIVFLTGYGDIPMTVRAMKGGAVDFLTKPVDGAVLLDRIAAAFAQGRKAQETARREARAQSRLARLTERERSILELALAGVPNKTIARQLGISFRTVEVHRSHILVKTGASTILELSRLMAEGESGNATDRPAASPAADPALAPASGAAAASPGTL